MVCLLQYACSEIRRRKAVDIRIMSARWTILLFAGLAERFGHRSLSLNWPERELTAGQVKSRLSHMYPEHEEIITVSFVAKNQTYAHDEETVSAEDELALLPPVSGGMEEAGSAEQSAASKRYVITEHPIDVNAVISQAAHPDHGALLAFVGMTREHTAGKRTLSLEYEAYVPMAEAAMKAIGEEIAGRWPGAITAITHRIGSVGIGEASVVIAVSAPHRAEAYEASRYAIERLKQTVPIWKKEIYEDGTEWKGHQTGPWNPLGGLSG
jgi:molybdopterin synthase catalytic subunit